MKKIITGLMVLASTQFLMAEATPITKIKDIYVYGDYIVMKLENSHSNPHNCNGSKEHIYLQTNTEAGKKMYSAALSASVAGRKVRFGINSCNPWGSKSIAKAYNVTLLK